jgi:hypothetical protein
MTAEHLSPENVGLLVQHAAVAHFVLTHQELRRGADKETLARVSCLYGLRSSQLISASGVIERRIGSTVFRQPGLLYIPEQDAGACL